MSDRLAVRILATIVFLSETVSPKTWYVTQGHASESRGCGGHGNQCHSIVDVLLQALDGDVVLVDGNSTSMYELCGDRNRTQLIQVSVTVIGYNGRPLIGCRGGGPGGGQIMMDDDGTRQSTNLIAVFATSSKLGLKVTFEKVTLSNGQLELGSGEFAFEEVHFYNVSMTTFRCKRINVYVSNSTWTGMSVCPSADRCSTTRATSLVCDNLDAVFRDSTFYQTAIELSGTAPPSRSTFRLIVDRCHFWNSPDQLQRKGGLKLVFGPNASRVEIFNSSFRNQVNPTRVMSIVNLFEAALWIKCVSMRGADGRQLQFSTARVAIVDTDFVDNERGLTAVGPFYEFFIERCKFAENVAMHAGAAILVLVQENTTIHVSECSFVGNAAGKFRRGYPLDEVGEFHVNGNNEVRISAACCKGLIGMVGKGGAIRLQRGNLDVRHVRFVNNTATLLGGSLFIDMKMRVRIFNSSFENTPEHAHALQGDLIYSDGDITAQYMRFKVITAQNMLSILRHSGSYWSIFIQDVWVQCPVGFNLRVSNSSAYNVEKSGLKRSHYLDQLSYFCQSCPRNKYSLGFGFLNYTLKYEDKAHFTLLINTSAPKIQSTGKYEHHEISCHDCPYGGKCVQEIVAVANFWGYHDNHSVKFQNCPRGYCCSSKTCSSINGCTDDRVGRLCGRCRDGFSEALFSPVCVPNSSCTQMWVLPFVVILGLLYALFLFFQTDLKEFLFSEPIHWGLLPGMAARWRRRVPTSAVASNKTTASSSSVLMSSTNKRDERTLLNGGSESHEVACCSANHANQSPPPSPTESNGAAKRTSSSSYEAGSGLLITLFYYFQDSLILQVDTVFVKTESRGQFIMRSILSGLFKLQLDLLELIKEVCAMPNLTPVPKLLARAIVVPYVIAIFGSMYVMDRCLRFICPNDVSEQETPNRKTFSVRLSTGFILTLLFTFQKMGTTVFSLLNCVPVDDKLVLFLDGTIECYQTWQFGVIGYAVLCVSPFCVVLMFGPYLMTLGVISLAEFFCACMCPTPFLFHWFVKYRCGCKRRVPQTSDTTAVLRVLQGPFRDSDSPICWAGVLIARRLVLVLLYTFVTDKLLRMLAMLLVCFLILLHHVHTQPYRDVRANLGGTVTASSLVILGVVNLVRAGFEAAEYTPVGPNQRLMTAFNHLENLLMLWSPTFIMSIVVLLFLFRCTRLALRNMNMS